MQRPKDTVKRNPANQQVRSSGSHLDQATNKEAATID